MGKESFIPELIGRGLSIGPAEVSRQIITIGGTKFEVIVKSGLPGSNLYQREVLGARTLNPYLPIVHPLGFFGPDKAIYPKVNAPSLHEYVLKFESAAWNVIQIYLDLHLHLWQKTINGNYDQPRSGYGNKIIPTQNELFNFLQKLPHFELDKPLTVRVNGQDFEIASVIDSLNWMEETIIQALKQGICLTHGDENWGNCLVRRNGKLVMIDLGDAGYRSPFEAMAKAITWLSATQFQPQSFLYRTTGVAKPLLQVTDKIEPWIIDLENQAQQHLQEQTRFLNLRPDQFNEYLGAFRMMYLLREGLYYCSKRNRSEARYSLIARALSLSAPYL